MDLGAAQWKRSLEAESQPESGTGLLNLTLSLAIDRVMCLSVHAFYRI